MLLEFHFSSATGCSIVEENFTCMNFKSLSMKIETRKIRDYSGFTTLETVCINDVKTMNKGIHLFDPLPNI